jgi:bifunctional DNA-binding transcriptional regulator/antitoxin component of YhaV-PrlF toxin-antitoxin module
MVKVVVNNGQYKITIPKDLAEEKGWTSKTKLRFVEDAEGNIILKEMKQEGGVKRKKR